MNYYSLCFLIMIILSLTIILFIFSKYNQNIETLENANDKSNSSSNINMAENINMAGNIIIDFNKPPGIHAELDKLFIWRRLFNCCIIDIAYSGNYIYGVGTNGIIFRAIKTGGDWVPFINNNSVTNTNTVNNLLIVGNFIYTIGSQDLITYKRSIDGTGDWLKIGQDGWQSKQLFSDNKYLYAIGLDFKINYIPLDGGTWKNYSQGYVSYGTIYKNKIYAIGSTDNAVHIYPLLPPPKENFPICKPYDNTIWAFCGDNPIKKWGIGPEGEEQAQRNCNYASSTNNFGKCPIVYDSVWSKLLNCCVTYIVGYNDYLYGTGTDGLIYRVSLEKGGEWEVFIKNGWVGKFIIENDNIYGIGSDKSIFIHPIKNDKVEGYTNENFAILE